MRARSHRIPTTISTRPGLALSLLLALVVLPAAAQPPAGYYDTVDTANGSTLRQTLHEVIDDHSRFPYTSASTDTWDILNLADEDPNDIGRVVDVYKNASYAKISGGTGAYNREHSWPKSYGFPNDGSTNYAYTDCHHLFVSDAGYNSSRSNKPYRNCDAGCSEKTTDLTDGRGGGSGVYPGNSNWTQGSFSQGTWETWPGRKGDVARALLYMDVRYEGGIHSGTGVAEPDLVLTDIESLIDASNTGSNESVAYMGMLSILLEWHVDDPVDSREIWRNEVIYSFQGNRNPFIDHPEWVTCLFEEQCSLDVTPPSAPSGLVATAGDGSATLSWNAGSEPDLAGYNVYRATVSGGPYTKVNSGLVATNAYVDSGLVNGTSHYWVVTSVDSSNNESGDSNEASGTPQGGPDITPPDPPSGLTATARDGSVSLDWDSSSEGDLDGYNVWRATVTGGPYSTLNSGLIASSDFVDSAVDNGTSYYYVVTAVDTSGNESGDSDETSATPVATGAGGLILSEVMYDPEGSDNNLEWVELYNGSAATIDLSAYSLGAGGTSYTYSTVQLSGSIAPGATFVVGGKKSNGKNGNPSFDLKINFDPDFQNSGSTADGVALFDVPAAQITGSTVPVDAVVYGGANSSGLIDETGAVAAPEVGDAASGQSIERVDLAGAWRIQTTPTPNSIDGTQLAGGGGGGGSVLLSEVFYDASGADDGLEWVELHNPGPLAVDLSGFSLGYGGTSYTYGTYQLSGTLGAGETLVVGGPTSSALNGDPFFDLASDFGPDLQNSGSTADGVALFEVPATQIDTSTVPVDAVVYGGSNGSGLIDESGGAGAPEVGDAAAGQSIERVDAAGIWRIQSSPTPNTVAGTDL